MKTYTYNGQRTNFDVSETKGIIYHMCYGIIYLGVRIVRMRGFLIINITSVSVVFLELRKI